MLLSAEGRDQNDVRQKRKPREVVAAPNRPGLAWPILLHISVNHAHGG